MFIQKRSKTLKREIVGTCGYGCQIHHVLSSLMIAYGMNRTFLSVLSPRHYTPKRWNGIFQPITNYNRNAISALRSKCSKRWSKIHERQWQTKSSIKSNCIPKPILWLIHLHADPSVLWIIQFLAFLKFLLAIQKFLRGKDLQINFSEPVTGIHIRRTGKIN